MLARRTLTARGITESHRSRHPAAFDLVEGGRDAWSGCKKVVPHACRTPGTSAEEPVHPLAFEEALEDNGSLSVEQPWLLQEPLGARGEEERPLCLHEQLVVRAVRAKHPFTHAHGS